MWLDRGDGLLFEEEYEDGFDLISSSSSSNWQICFPDFVQLFGILSSKICLEVDVDGCSQGLFPHCLVSIGFLASGLAVLGSRERFGGL